MKKKYIIPEIVILTMQTEMAFLAGSTGPDASSVDTTPQALSKKMDYSGGIWSNMVDDDAKK